MVSATPRCKDVQQSIYIYLISSPNPETFLHSRHLPASHHGVPFIDLTCTPYKGSAEYVSNKEVICTTCHMLRSQQTAPTSFITIASFGTGGSTRNPST
eukprot:761140-Hanusia_phi.AAC.1